MLFVHGLTSRLSFCFLDLSPFSSLLVSSEGEMCQVPCQYQQASRPGANIVLGCQWKTQDSIFIVFWTVNAEELNQYLLGLSQVASWQELDISASLWYPNSYIFSIIHPDVWSDSDTGRPICAKYPSLHIPGEWEYSRQPGWDAQADLHSEVDQCAGEPSGRRMSA